MWPRRCIQYKEIRLELHPLCAEKSGCENVGIEVEITAYLSGTVVNTFQLFNLLYQQQSKFPEIFQRSENATQEQRLPRSFRQQTSVAAFKVSLHPHDLHDHTYKTCYTCWNAFYDTLYSRPATRFESFVCGLLCHHVRTHSQSRKT